MWPRARSCKPAWSRPRRAIPTSIVERVEVLTGGASAIYGSDAVAGVVNIVLRENYEGNQIRGSVGTTAHGGGDRLSAK